MHIYVYPSTTVMRILGVSSSRYAVGGAAFSSQVSFTTAEEDSYHVSTVIQNGQTKHWLYGGPFFLVSFVANTGSPSRLDERRDFQPGAFCNFTTRCHQILQTGPLSCIVWIKHCYIAVVVKADISQLHISLCNYILKKKSQLLKNTWCSRVNISPMVVSPATVEASNLVLLVHFFTFSTLHPCTWYNDKGRFSCVTLKQRFVEVLVSTSPHISAWAEVSWQQFSVVALMYSYGWIHFFFPLWFVAVCLCKFSYVLYVP